MIMLFIYFNLSLASLVVRRKKPILNLTLAWLTLYLHGLTFKLMRHQAGPHWSVLSSPCHVHSSLRPWHPCFFVLECISLHSTVLGQKPIYFQISAGNSQLSFVVWGKLLKILSLSFFIEE